MDDYSHNNNYFPLPGTRTTAQSLPPSRDLSLTLSVFICSLMRSIVFYKEVSVDTHTHRNTDSEIGGKARRKPKKNDQKPRKPQKLRDLAPTIKGFLYQSPYRVCFVLAVSFSLSFFAGTHTHTRQRSPI